MGKWCQKHVEALNPNKSESESESVSEVCIKLVVFITLGTICIPCTMQLYVCYRYIHGGNITKWKFTAVRWSIRLNSVYKKQFLNEFSTGCRDCPTNALSFMRLYLHNGSYMLRQNNAILKEQLGSFLSYFNVNIVGDKSWNVRYRPMCQRVIERAEMKHYQVHTAETCRSHRVNKEAYKLVDSLVSLYIFDKARYKNQN
jgi:hypothetical protein